MPVVELNGDLIEVGEKITAGGLKKLLNLPKEHFKDYWTYQWLLPHEPQPKTCKCFACVTYRLRGRFTWKLDDPLAKNMFFIFHEGRNVRFQPVDGERYTIKLWSSGSVLERGDQ